jgi:hypothetical protein
MKAELSERPSRLRDLCAVEAKERGQRPVSGVVVDEHMPPADVVVASRRGMSCFVEGLKLQALIPPPATVLVDGLHDAMNSDSDITTA